MENVEKAAQSEKNQFTLNTFCTFTTKKGTGTAKDELAV